MKIVSAERGAGKTHESVTWCLAGENRVLVVLNHERKNRILREYGTERRDAIALASRVKTVADLPLLGFANGLRVAVDDVDAVLTAIVSGPVDFVTVTEDDRMKGDVRAEAERLWELAREEHLILRPYLSADALAEYREAFIAGGIEHGNDWVKWPLPRFAAERHAEEIDIANYTIMENLRRKGLV